MPSNIGTFVRLILCNIKPERLFGGQNFLSRGRGCSNRLFGGSLRIHTDFPKNLLDLNGKSFILKVSHEVTARQIKL